MSRWRWLLVLAGGCFPALAAVTEEQQINHYPIAPDSATALNQALWRDSPVMADGQSYGGHTTWTVTPRYGLVQELERCRLVEPAVALRIVISLPQLVDGSSEPLRQQFAALYQPLLAHEQIHAELGRRAAAAIDRLMATEPLAPDCAEADGDLVDAMDRLLRFWGAQNEELDRVTSHGLYPDNYQLPGD